MKAIICIILSIAALAHAQIDIPCNFVFAENEYTCRLPQVDLAQFDNFVISSNNHLPGQSNINVVSFVSINNNFQTFPTTHLVQFPNLISIKVTGSNITNIPAQAIAGRAALRRLNLNSNMISHINPLAFTGTVGLEHIQLMFNRLTYADNAVFGLFNNLIELDLSSNLFATIPNNTLLNNAALVALSMSGNQITFIERTFFDHLLQLRTFNFLTNPCYSGSFINLHTITARNDMIRRLEPCFEQGPKRLTCSFGYEFQGVNFETYTCLLRDIEVLDQNEEIELTGFHMAGRTNANVNLVWIDASNVRYIITQAFNTFPNLQRLQIQGSNLQYLQPGAFTNATSLLELTITMNALRRLEANSFQHAINLQVINMWFNSLESIHENAFVGLTNLRELHLFSGYLNNLPPTTFAPLPNLYLVEIGRNRLPIIDHRWFAQNPQIGQLLFNTNQIDAIFPAIVDMPNLTQLRLRENVCIDNEFLINDQTREQVRQELRQCFDNYPLRQQRFILDVEGDVALFDEDGLLVVQL